LSSSCHQIRVVVGATHSQKDGAEGRGGSCKDIAESFVLFLYDVQLVLSSTHGFDFNEVDVTLKYAKIFRSMLSGEGGSADGKRCY